MASHAAPVIRDQWRTRVFTARLAIVGALAVLGALGLGRFGYTMLLPATREGLQLSYTEAGWLGTANLAGYLLGCLGAGRVARLGVPGATSSGLLAVAVSLGWMAFAHATPDAAAARFVAGLGGAIVYVHSLGLVGRLPAEARGLVSGIMHAGVGVGLMITGVGIPLVLANSTEHGWRTAWFLLGVAVFSIAPLAWLGLRPPTAPPSSSASGSRRGARSEPAASVSTWACLCGVFGVSYVIYLTFFAAALQSRGLSLQETGWAWAAVGALSLASGPAWGALSDRLGRMITLTLLFALHALAYGSFLLSGSWGPVLSLLIFGPTAWAIPAVAAAAMGDREPDEAVRAFGFVTLVSSLGQAIGPLLAGVAADVTSQVSAGLWVSVAAAAVGMTWSLVHSLAWPARTSQRSA